MTEPLTDEQCHEIREYYKSQTGGLSIHDRTILRLLATIDALRKERDALRKALEDSEATKTLEPVAQPVDLGAPGRRANED